MKRFIVVCFALLFLFAFVPPAVACDDLGCGHKSAVSLVQALVSDLTWARTAIGLEAQTGKEAQDLQKPLSELASSRLIRDGTPNVKWYRGYQLFRNYGSIDRGIYLNFHTGKTLAVLRI